MRFLDRLRSAPPAPRPEPPLTRAASAPVEVKASAAASALVAWEVGQPQWHDHDFETVARETYMLNAVAHRCVKLVATCAAVAPLMEVDAKLKPLAQPVMLDLLHRPNPRQSAALFMEAVYTYAILSGTAYIEGVGPLSGGVRELWTHRPDHMKVVPGPFGLPQKFVFERDGRTVEWPVNPTTGESRILQILRFHPTDPWYGLAAAHPAAFGTQRHNQASKHNKALLDNGARPSGGLIFEPVSSGNGLGATSAPKEVLEAAEKELEKRHVGARNAGKPMVLGGNVRWEQFGLTPMEMDFNQGKIDAARDICLAFGVPSVLILPGESTFSNYEQAKLSLYEETVLPLVSFVLGELSDWLAPKVGSAGRLIADLDAIPALEPRRKERRETIAGLLESGVIDVDEARAEFDYGPWKKDSVRSFDADKIRALVEASAAVGMQPLHRYLRSVGLIEPGMSEEALVGAALALIEDEDEDEDTQDDANPDEDQETDDDDQA